MDFDDDVLMDILVFRHLFCQEVEGGNKEQIEDKFKDKVDLDFKIYLSTVSSW